MLLEAWKTKKKAATSGLVTSALLVGLCCSVSESAEVFRDCTRDLYDRVVRFEYLYYDGYWMYPYNKLKQHGPSYHYTEKEFCKFI